MIQEKHINGEIHIVSEKPEELFPCDPYKAAALKCAAELMNDCLDNMRLCIRHIQRLLDRGSIFLYQMK